jgi:hypothetical protein
MRYFRQKSDEAYVTDHNGTLVAMNTPSVDEAVQVADLETALSLSAGTLESVELGSAPTPSGTVAIPQPTRAWNDNDRNERNQKLSTSDWTQGEDSPLGSSKKTEWATYRQSLRDLPTSQANAEAITWPSEPS